jgi:hypothetical protein
MLKYLKNILKFILLNNNTHIKQFKNMESLQTFIIHAIGFLFIFGACGIGRTPESEIKLLTFNHFLQMSLIMVGVILLSLNAR